MTALRQLALSRRRPFLAAFLLLASLSASSQARPTEYDVKAAYLFNFGKFIRVSPTGLQRSSFDICVLGADPVAPALEALTAGEQIDNRSVRIRRIKDPADARSCDIAYIAASEDTRIDSDLAALRNANVLTVGDARSFLTRGGMIQFVLIASHVRFVVNLDAVRRTHLVLSSELLRVAARVTDAPTPEDLP